MKLTSESSIIVTWNDQLADWFTIYITLDQYLYQQNDSTENICTFTGIPPSVQYQIQIQAVFIDRLSLFSDIITIDSK